ncbi:Triple Functional Domain Protein [Manis pentadactyla]|nr:Triple Functional Domain Protein [Manis pentadactyla]
MWLAPEGRRRARARAVLDSQAGVVRNAAALRAVAAVAERSGCDRGFGPPGALPTVPPLGAVPGLLSRRPAPGSGRTASPPPGRSSGTRCAGGVDRGRCGTPRCPAVGARRPRLPPRPAVQAAGAEPGAQQPSRARPSRDRGRTVPNLR